MEYRGRRVSRKAWREKLLTATRRLRRIAGLQQPKTMRRWALREHLKNVKMYTSYAVLLCAFAEYSPNVAYSRMLCDGAVASMR
jgi:hypothetical protein